MKKRGKFRKEKRGGERKNGARCCSLERQGWVTNSKLFGPKGESTTHNGGKKELRKKNIER